MLDVVIVGAGPAGLSAALVLGRCRRRVVVCDAGRPRNASARNLHGFLTRDGTPPRELLRMAREELRPYETVEVRQVEAVDVRRLEAGFELVLADGATLAARKLLIATGIVDALPEIDGVGPLYGRSVHHCPYCDGWEWRDRPLAIYGRGARGLKMAFRMTAWSRDLVLCTDGPADLRPEDRASLDRLKIPVREGRIVRLEGDEEGRLRHVVFDSGERLAREALFFNTDCWQRSRLLAALDDPAVDPDDPELGKHENTELYGVYVAGDASRDVQFAIVAAAEGANAAVGINTALTWEELERQGVPRLD